MNSNWELCTGMWNAWVGATKRRSLVHFCVVSGLVNTLYWHLEKPAWGQRKCARPNADHWSILISVLAWWAHNTGIWKSLLGISWSARDQTQIIGPFWFRFWLGEHIILAFEKACLGSAEVRATKRRSLVHFNVGSDLVSTLWWLLSVEFGHMTRITSVVGLTCCTFADSFLKHSPC